ncbi:MAG: hypothetical protein ACK5MR_17720 [Cumulibacter sp.]
MSKKTDSVPDADFGYVERLKDAIMTAKNTFVRHMTEKITNARMITFHSLNPWGEGNPLVVDFHKIMGDDLKKLVNKGYNLAYLEEEETLTICATTNYKINTKLNDKARKSINPMRKDARAGTMIYGMTGRVANSSFGSELTVMEGLNRGGNIPQDQDFHPVNFSMDIGTAAASVFYVNGVDTRYVIKSGNDFYPVRLITKGEYVIDPKKDLSSSKERYMKFLHYVYKLSLRWPTIRRTGINLYIDGSAIDTVELLKAYIKEIENENPSYNISN